MPLKADDDLGGFSRGLFAVALASRPAVVRASRPSPPIHTIFIVSDDAMRHVGLRLSLNAKESGDTTLDCASKWACISAKNPRGFNPWVNHRLSSTVRAWDDLHVILVGSERHKNMRTFPGN
jgi:hypothetical protein